MTGAFTNNDPEYIAKTSLHIIQYDYNSLYPNCIINFSIDPDNFVGVVSDVSNYAAEQFSTIEVSDDNKFRNKAERSYAVYEKKPDSILVNLAIRLLKLRQDYKDKEGAAKKKGDKVAEKKFRQLQLITKTQANALFGGMSSQANPYFQYIIGASITAAARFCLQQANKTCH